MLFWSSNTIPPFHCSLQFLFACDFLILPLFLLLLTFVVDCNCLGHELIFFTRLTYLSLFYIIKEIKDPTYHLFD